MFNRKLKKQIEELTKRVKKLEEQNEILCFKVENPSGVAIGYKWSCKIDYDDDYGEGYYVKYLLGDEFKEIRIPSTSFRFSKVAIDKDCNITVENQTPFCSDTTKYKLNKLEGILIQIGETEKKLNYGNENKSKTPKKEKSIKKGIKKND